jgi:hypothetical protein
MIVTGITFWDWWLKFSLASIHFNWEKWNKFSCKSKFNPSPPKNNNFKEVFSLESNMAVEVKQYFWSEYLVSLTHPRKQQKIKLFSFDWFWKSIHSNAQKALVQLVSNYWQWAWDWPQLLDGCKETIPYWRSLQNKAKMHLSTNLVPPCDVASAIGSSYLFRCAH